MPSVDERVVRMQFDNARFEQGVKQSVTSLNLLKKGLNLDSSAQSLSNLDNAGKKFSLEGISKGVDTLANKFTNLGIVGITALQNLTNRIIDMGTNMVKALTIDPIKSGLDEYETKINAIQTILTNTKSKGTTLDDVNLALADLNTYADKTIYNFQEMTRNIGTFTAAGVDLKVSTSSIKGIANLAAGSGSSALQASTAMYQLSQAIAAGSVKLMDWNSVVNAGMGGELFQTALKNTAKEMGIFVDESIPFRNSLESGWLSSEVLTATLTKFAEDETLLQAATQVKTFTQMISTMKESVQSGWAVSWENIIGNKDEAAALFTGINNAFSSIVGSSSDARNALLKFWHDNGGRAAILEGLTNIIKTLGSVIKPVTEAFREIFPATTGEQLVAISTRFKELTTNFKVGEETIKNIKNTFRGFFIILNFLKEVIILVAKAAFGIIKILLPFVDFIINITSGLGKGIEKLKVFIDSFKKIDMTPVEETLDKVKKRFEPLTKIGELFSFLLSKIEPFKDAIVNAFKSIKGALSESLVMPKLDFNTGLDIVNAGLFTAILVGIKMFIGSFSKITKAAQEGVKGFIGSIQSVITNINTVLNEVKTTLKDFQGQLKAKTLMTIATAIALLAASILVLSLIDSVKLGVSLGAITILFGELAAMMFLMENKIGKRRFNNSSKTVLSMVGLAIALNIMASAISKLAKNDPVRMSAAVGALTVLMGSIAGLMLLMEKKIGKRRFNDSSKIAYSMVGVAIALYIMSAALSKLAKLSESELTRAGIAVTLLMVMIGIMMKAMETIGKGGSLARVANSLIILSLSLFIFSFALAQLGKMKIKEIGKGLLALAGILLIVTLAFKFMPEDMISKAIGLTIIALALMLLVKSFEQMGKMKIEEIGKALLMLGGALLVITLAMNFMSGGIAGAFAMLIMAGALAILVPQIIALSKLSLGQIGISLLALLGIFAALGIAAIVLTPVVPFILLLAAAIVLLGVGALAAGFGLLALSAAFTAFVAIGVGGAAILAVVLGSLIDLIPKFLQKVGEGIVKMIEVLGNNATKIAAAFGKWIVAIIAEFAKNAITIVTLVADMIIKLLAKIRDALPIIIQLAIDIVLSFLTAIRDNIYQFVVLGAEIIVNYLNGIASKLPDIIDAGFNLVISFINGLADSVRENTPKLIEATNNLMDSFLEAAKLWVINAKDKFVEVGGNIVNGLVSGITGAISKPIEAIKDVGEAVLGSIKKALSIKSPSRKFMEIGMYSVQGFANGLRKFSNLAMNAAEGVGNKAVEALSNASRNMNAAIINNIDTSPVIKPVIDLSNISNGAKTIGDMLDPNKMSITTDGDLARMHLYSDKDASISNTTNINEVKPTFIINTNNIDEAQTQRLIRRINKELGELL